MARQRRYEQFLSFLFLSAGAALLLYAGATWFLSLQEARVVDISRSASPALSDLPPALSQAPPSLEQNQALAPPLAGLSNDAPLLPESPRAVEKETAVRSEGAETAQARASSEPRRIIIPALGVDAPVHAAGLETKQEGQRTYKQWSVPDTYAAGWHNSSAPLGEAGNTVLNGHNNVYGAVFAELASLAVGEQIILAGEDGAVVYRVAHHEMLKEHGAPLRERLRNARWIAPTADERLTLVTCWPNTTNSHRLIVVAEPEDTPGAALGPLLKRIQYELVAVQP